LFFMKRKIKVSLDNTMLPGSHFEKSPGNHNRGETPVPIPNTEVKPFSADGTARGAEWESRSLPGFFYMVSDGWRKRILIRSL
jgi:hypothetical protein